MCASTTNIQYDVEENRARVFYRNQRRLTAGVVAIMIVADILTVGFLPLFFLRASVYTTAWVWIMIMLWAFAFSALVTLAKVILGSSPGRIALFICEVVTGALTFTFLLVAQAHRPKQDWTFPTLVTTASLFVVFTQWITVLAVKDMCSEGYTRLRRG